MPAGLLRHSANSLAAIPVNTILLSGRMSEDNSSSAAWLIIFEVCLKDDSGIDLHDTDIDFLTGSNKSHASIANIRLALVHKKIETI